MSFDIGIKTLGLEPAERIGHTEYCAHASLIKHVTGLDFLSKDPEEAHQARKQFYQWAGYDFLFSTDDGRVWNTLGRTTDLGHAVYQEDGSDFRKNQSCPFTSSEEVLSFNAASEYGLPDMDATVLHYREKHAKNQALFPSQVYPGGYYKTLVSGCIHSFGWDMFLMALGDDADRFGEQVIEGFFQLTLAHYKAWSRTDIRAFICHDDFVWANGPFVNPKWYRKYILPRYKRLWKVLKDRGIKVLFCSDGKFNEFIDDLAEAGADGFIFEPLTDFEKIVSKYGRTHVIIGNLDCRILTYGSRQDIEKEVMRCIEPGKGCPGFMIAVGNHIPPEIPLENALYYFELVRKHGSR